MIYMGVVIWNILTLCAGLPAIAMLYLIYKKLNERVLKYAFFIGLPVVLGAFAYLLLLLLITDSNYMKEYAYVFGIYNHLVIFSIIICGIYFFHKIIQQKVPLYIKIGTVLLIIILSAGIFFRMTPKKMLDMSFTVTIYNLAMVPWFLLIKKAVPLIKIKPLKGFLKVYLILLPILVFLGFVYVIIKNFFPGLMIIFYYFDITSFHNISLGITMIYFMSNYFFQPLKNTEVTIPGDWAESRNLTKREMELLPLVVKGLTAVQISEQIFVTPQTAKNYISKLYRKIGVKNKFELINMVRDRKEFSFD